MNVMVLKVEEEELKVIKNFNHSVKNMQSVVGGRLTCVGLRYQDGREVTLWANEEGIPLGLEPNFVLFNKKTRQWSNYIYGDVIITAVDSEGKTVGLTDEEVEFVYNSFDFNYGTITPYFVTRTLNIG